MGHFFSPLGSNEGDTEGFPGYSSVERRPRKPEHKETVTEQKVRATLSKSMTLVWLFFHMENNLHNLCECKP